MINDLYLWIITFIYIIISIIGTILEIYLLIKYKNPIYIIIVTLFIILTIGILIWFKYCVFIFKSINIGIFISSFIISFFIINVSVIDIGIKNKKEKIK